MISMYIKWIITILVVLVILLCFYYSRYLYKQFKSEALKGLERTKILGNEILTEKDIIHLIKI